MATTYKAFVYVEAPSETYWHELVSFSSLFTC